MKKLTTGKPHKRHTSAWLAFVLSAVILLQTGCSFFGGSSDKVDVTELLPDQSGYDVVMVLDESGSLNENQILMRNKAANIFVRMLTKNCSLGTVFFSGKTHKKKGRDSLYKDTKQDEYLKLFGTGKEARKDRQRDGTRLNVGLDDGLKLLDGSNNPNQAIILFTDGINEGGDVNAADEQTKKKVRAARTANNGEPVPIYVVYLDQNNGKKSTNLTKLQTLFGYNGQDAFLIDSPENNPDAWDQVPWSDTSINKIIATDDPDALTEIFSNLLNKMRNLAAHTFKESPDEKKIAVIRFDVPDFAASRVQLIITGKKKFKVTTARHSQEKETSYGLNEEGKAGEYIVVSFDARDGSLEPGQWEIEVETESSVSGSVSLFSDFQTTVTLLQNKETVDTAKSFTDTQIKVALTDSSDKAINLGKGWSGKVTVGDQDFGDMKIDGNSFVSQPSVIPSEGEMPVRITLSYRKMLYTIDQKITVEDAPPALLRESSECIYQPSQKIGSLVDIGKTSDFMVDVKDKEQLRVEVKDNLGFKAYSLSYAEMAETLNIAVDEIPDNEPHIFLNGKSGKHKITITATDSDGHTTTGKAVINIRSKKEVESSRRTIISINLLILILFLIITFRVKHFSKERQYNVLAIINDGVAIAPIPIMCDLDTKAQIRIFLNRQYFFLKDSNYTKRDRFKGLPFILDAGKTITLRLSALRAFIAHKPMFRFTLETVSAGGDNTKITCFRKCQLKPDKTYIVRYDGKSLRLSFSEHDSWSDIFTSLLK